MESEWLQIVIHEFAKAGAGELAKWVIEKTRSVLERVGQQAPEGGWIPIGVRIFEGGDFEQVLDDTEEVPPLLEQAALAASRAESTRLNLGYFECRVNGKFHEYWAVGLPWIPSVDISRIAQEPYEFPEEIQDMTMPSRAAILYYSRVADEGQPYDRACATAAKLLR